MKVYSLLSSVNYEGSTLEGVFGSVEDLLECVKTHKAYTYGAEPGEECAAGVWDCDQLGYVESELGEKITDELPVTYVEFTRFSYA